MPKVMIGKPDIFFGGQLNQAVTSVTLVNTTAKTIDIEVPAGKRWILLCIRAVNGDDVTRQITVKKYKEAAKTNLIASLVDSSVPTLNPTHFPNSVTGVFKRREVAASPAEMLVAGNTVEVFWSDPGASAGSTDADGLVSEYLED